LSCQEVRRLASRRSSTGYSLGMDSLRCPCASNRIGRRAGAWEPPVILGEDPRDAWRDDGACGSSGGGRAASRAGRPELRRSGRICRPGRDRCPADAARDPERPSQDGCRSRMFTGARGELLPR
jgi:hypothetical protein